LIEDYARKLNIKKKHKEIEKARLRFEDALMKKNINLPTQELEYPDKRAEIRTKGKSLETEIRRCESIIEELEIACPDLWFKKLTDGQFNLMLEPNWVSAESAMDIFTTRTAQGIL
jgi:hypothetical protein